MTLFALIDCNNFYASCERIFNAGYKNKPIVVLSNNDGCVIARSEEAKALGISMGSPFFECKNICKKYDVAVLSSNFELYGNISSRVMNIIKNFAEQVEVYSIDEAFIKLENNSPEIIYENIKTLRKIIKKSIGITVSIGVGNSKTLAKIANKLAKQRDDGIFHLQQTEEHEKILQAFNINDIWGVGRKLDFKLRMMGIGTAAELRDTDPKIIRKHFTVVGEKLVMELRGFPCYKIEDVADKKNIIYSRSFGKDVTNINELEEAIADYAVKACEKMRDQNSCTLGFYLFFRIKSEKPGKLNYQYTDTYWFNEHTNDTFLVIKKAKELLSKFYKNGNIYKKIGITLLDLTPENKFQKSFFSDSTATKETLLKTMSDINKKMGSNTIFIAAQGIKREWSMKSGNKSPRFTTRWAELLKVK